MRDDFKQSRYRNEGYEACGDKQMKNMNKSRLGKDLYSGRPLTPGAVKRCATCDWPLVCPPKIDACPARSHSLVSLPDSTSFLFLIGKNNISKGVHLFLTSSTTVSGEVCRHELCSSPCFALESSNPRISRTYFLLTECFPVRST